MAFSPTERGSITTFTNPTQGDEQFNVDELDIQEQVGCKFDKITDFVVTRKDELDDGHQLSDHSGIGEEEIPVVGMSFGSLPLAQKFYANYAKKVGFVTKIRNTNFDKTRKELKIPVNQSIYCTREGYRESRVNAATRANKITATRCRARMYVVLDNENECWVMSRLELRHSHPCSAEKAVHYHEYRELTMHAKCVITDNDEAGIRPNKTYLALANEVGGSANLGFSEKDELEDDAAYSKGVIPCIGSTALRDSFNRNTPVDSSTGGKKKTDCVVRSIEQKGDTISITVDEQKVFWGKPVYHTFRVDFDPLSRKGQCECNKFESTVPGCYVLPRWSKNVIRKHTYVKSSHDVARSDESNNLIRHLCSEFYNVVQEFVACDEEAAILRAALWDVKSKLIDYRGSMRSTNAVASQNTVPTQSTGGAIVHDIQGPSRVKTKGRPKGKRLGAELDKSIKKSMQKRNRKSHLDEVDLPSDNDHHGSLSKRFEDSIMWNSSEGGGFMHLLNSFRHI
ncbi:hypothetical protein Ahy_A09g046132 [Arachis hypogaea]|uniref:FAR1 domain-containing protein n=1 Tax=Arachis hypogaea TaxID=3818 RepID=A0A445BNX4_ARAHY|nr:hypothetical protein Ahy_A09g046132 [Arachis hypogaea]